MLQNLLLQQGYVKIKLRLTTTNHLETKAFINGIKGRFIIDTGASSSCVDFEAIETFKLRAEDSFIKAVGAGASDMETKVSKTN